MVVLATKLRNNQKSSCNRCMILLLKPMESDTYNLMSLVNKYMDRYRNTGSVDDKARAEKQARMVAKSIITGGVDMANMGANSFFYEASESLLTSAIMILSEFGDPGTRHISSAHKLIDAVSVKKKGEPNLYRLLGHPTDQCGINGHGSSNQD